MEMLFILLVIALVVALLPRLFRKPPRVKQKELSGFPYALEDHFLSPAELNFFHVLRETIGDRAVVCSKVNLNDVFRVQVSNGSDYLGYRNKIDRKHVDFLLCHPVNMQPILAIELDDRSHERQDRQERDAFVDSVFKAAKLPLIHIAAKRAYTTADLATQISPYLQVRPVVAPQLVTSSQTLSHENFLKSPPCPKCGSVMTLRVAKNGKNAGSKFWGCSTYPDCRGMVSISSS